MYDTHVHSKFSSDGVSHIEEYIKLFDEGKIKKLGFAEHRDFLPCCGAYKFMRYSDYYSCIKAYRARGYEVYAGAEIDYVKEVEEEIVETLKNEHYDFTICSVHMVDQIPLADKRSIDLLMEMENLKVVLDTYYKELYSGIKVQEFDVIGHIGIYKRYLGEEFLIGKQLHGWINETETELARECAHSDKIIEVNTSGLFAPVGSTIVDNRFLKQYYSCGGRRVSIGSDAHDATRVSAGFSQAEEVLKDIGFKYVYLPWDKENPLKLG